MMAEDSYYSESDSDYYSCESEFEDDDYELVPTYSNTSSISIHSDLDIKQSAQIINQEISVCLPEPISTSAPSYTIPRSPINFSFSAKNLDKVKPKTNNTLYQKSLKPIFESNFINPIAPIITDCDPFVAINKKYDYSVYWNDEAYKTSALQQNPLVLRFFPLAKLSNDYSHSKSNSCVINSDVRTYIGHHRRSSAI